MRTLIVAAGGGGDAITGSALTAHLGLESTPIVLTYSWDRLMVDPLPGPRAAADFTGLRSLAPHVLEILPTTRPRTSAGSSLPRLATDLPARLLLLDPARGAAGVADQIRAAAQHFHCTDVALLDVGGDALTDGADPGLRSPLADQLAIAGSIRAGLPTRLLVAAPGVDGELPAEIVIARLENHGAEQLKDFTPAELACVRQVYSWHPSEASGLLTAAAFGTRGQVEVRDAGDRISLSATTPTLYALDLDKIATDVPAAALTETQNLTEAADAIRRETGISEIDYETAKASRLQGRRPHHPSKDDLDIVDQHAAETAARGSQYISMRRLAELMQSTTLAAFAELNELLAAARASQYQPSLYRVG